MITFMTFLNLGGQLFFLFFFEQTITFVELVILSFSLSFLFFFSFFADTSRTLKRLNSLLFMFP